MNGTTGRVDALAAKLALRPELAVAMPDIGLDGAPSPVVQVQKVDNDVRLPSRALHDRQLPTGAAAAASHPSVPPAGVAPSPAAQLSVAARVIGAVLAQLQCVGGPVRGATPVWPSMRAPVAAALADTLAQTVASSGLFYESHLLQFASGTRALAQLAQEPQVRRAMPAPSAADSPRPVPAPAHVPDAPGPDALIGPADAEPLPDTAGSMRKPAAAPSSPADMISVSVAGRPTLDAARAQATYRWVEDAGTVQRTARDTAQVRQDTGAAAADRAAHGPAADLSIAQVVHPQTMSVVHQQLDLLATAVFRWSGQAWPGAAMAWSIQEERDEARDPSAALPEEDRPRSWSTTVSLGLPRLGAVELRLSLVGAQVQARFAASESATIARLRTDGGELAQRLEAAGLRLQALQVTAMGEAA